MCFGDTLTATLPLQPTVSAMYDRHATAVSTEIYSQGRVSGQRRGKLVSSINKTASLSKAQ